MDLQQIQNNLAELTKTLPAPTSSTDNNPALNYHMSNLYGILSGLAAGIKDLKDSNITKEDLETVVSPLTQTIESNTTRINELEKTTNHLAKNQANHLTGISHEIDSRLRKQNNIIIFRLPESTKPNNKDKKSDDMETVNQLLADINMGSTATQAVKTMFRVQKSNKQA